MRRIRVLIVDDSAVVRRIVSDVLAGDPAIEVVGAAASGQIALAKIPRLEPDILTLDVDMPEMTGLETLSSLRARHPSLPVIMLSTLTERGAAATLEALSMGARDYVTKPSGAGSPALALERIREELILKIKTFCRPGWTPEPAAERDPAPLSVPAGALARAAGRVELVAIGASTGGPNAIASLLADVPAGFPVPIVIVQHMPPIFTRLLAERLAARSRIEVKEASTGDVLHAGAAWVAPGDHHLVLERDRGCVRTFIHRGPPENSCRPSVDALFRSAADAYGAGVLAIVLTGMGHDGRSGSARIREAEGQILVQDETSSVVWGMPGNVYRAGLADEVVSIEELPGVVLRRVQAGRGPMMDAGSSNHG